MLAEDPQALFDQFVPKVRAYLESPGVMAALELDGICEKLYPLVSRKWGHTELSVKIRSFRRALPRGVPEELSRLFDEIMENARQAGLV